VSLAPMKEGDGVLEGWDSQRSRESTLLRIGKLPSAPVRSPESSEQQECA
jgi:hypothetical protein